MKIHFSNVNFSSGAGPNTFAHRLAHQLSLDGHIVADQNDYDVVLIFIEPGSKLDLNKPIIQRLDGIWFKPNEFKSKNVNIRSLYEKANHVIFQSEFDRTMALKHFGEPRQSSVIHNGISLERVKTQREALLEIRSRYDKVFVCSSNWHPQKRLGSNVKLWKHLRSTQFPNSCLIIMGDSPDVRIADPNVFYTGAIPSQMCLEIYSISDWMIHLAWADHCPNVVCEALSQGCPVICAEIGGTKELVGTNGIILRDQEKYDFTLYDYDNPPDIDVEQLTSLSDIKFEVNQDLDIAKVAHDYVNTFEFVLKNS